MTLEQFCNEVRGYAPGKRFYVESQVWCGSDGISDPRLSVCVYDVTDGVNVHSYGASLSGLCEAIRVRIRDAQAHWRGEQLAGPDVVKREQAAAVAMIER